jgi:hypothetical protein
VALAPTEGREAQSGKVILQLALVALAKGEIGREVVGRTCEFRIMEPVPPQSHDGGGGGFDKLLEGLDPSEKSRRAVASLLFGPRIEDLV